MGLYDNRPLTEEELRQPTRVTGTGTTIRQVSATGKVYTVRHRPWWELLGVGPEGQTCGDCANLKTYRRSKAYFKCGKQVATSGPGTDIRKHDLACRLFET
jgi:hypothetical protein